MKKNHFCLERVTLSKEKNQAPKKKIRGKCDVPENYRVFLRSFYELIAHNMMFHGLKLSEICQTTISVPRSSSGVIIEKTDLAPKDTPENLENKALKGDSEALQQLGDCSRSVGDITKARQFHEKAAAQGHGIAQYYLDHIYEKGKGGPRDVKKAGEWYTRAAQQGLLEAKPALHDVKKRMKE